MLSSLGVTFTLWVVCVAGALSDSEYPQKLTAAGFESVNIEATRVYNVDDAREFLKAAKVQDKFISAFVRAQKPAATKSCCGPTCCAAN